MICFLIPLYNQIFSSRLPDSFTIIGNSGPQINRQTVKFSQYSGFPTLRPPLPLLFLPLRTDPAPLSGRKRPVPARPPLRIRGTGPPPGYPLCPPPPGRDCLPRSCGSARERAGVPGCPQAVQPLRSASGPVPEADPGVHTGFRPYSSEGQEKRPVRQAPPDPQRTLRETGRGREPEKNTGKWGRLSAPAGGLPPPRSPPEDRPHRHPDRRLSWACSGRGRPAGRAAGSFRPGVGSSRRSGSFLFCPGRGAGTGSAPGRRPPQDRRTGPHPPRRPSEPPAAL